LDKVSFGLRKVASLRRIYNAGINATDPASVF
jgi:hypothetical protein